VGIAVSLDGDGEDEDEDGGGEVWRVEDGLAVEVDFERLDGREEEVDGEGVDTSRLAMPLPLLLLPATVVAGLAAACDTSALLVLPSLAVWRLDAALLAR